MELRMAALASGSRGNSIYIGSGNHHLLIDAGLSGKKTQEGLAGLGLSLTDIEAVLITHEHTDHIGGLGVLLRKCPVPVYGTAGTLQALLDSPDGRRGRVPAELLREITPDEDFRVGDLRISPFRVSHDGREPAAYRVRCGERSVAVVTDLGTYDEALVRRLQGLDALLLETNHDVGMLELGPYPYMLKQRILGGCGHLSNESAGRLLNELLHDGMEHILLGHLSKENNYPALAYEAVRTEITLGRTPYKGSDFPISIAGQESLSEIIVLT